MNLFTINNGEVMITVDGVVVFICCTIVLLSFLGMLGAIILLAWLSSFVWRIYSVYKDIKEGLDKGQEITGDN